MIKVLILLILTISIVFVAALCKISSRSDKNAEIILKKYKDDKKHKDVKK